MTDEAESKNSKFEFGAAVTLGIAAVVSAWAAHQSGLWGGNCITAYSEAGRVTTEAATTYQELGSSVFRDMSLDIQATQLLMEMQALEEGPMREGKRNMVQYIYGSQISDAAAEQLGIPAQHRHSAEEIPDEVLFETLNHGLHDDFWSEQVAVADAEFTRAETKFAEGQRANQHGDGYGFAGVILTISMFFSGISLVFKSSARWALLALGGVTLVLALGLMLMLPFAGWGVGDPAPTPATEGAASSGDDGEAATEEAGEEAPSEPRPVPTGTPAAPAPTAAARNEAAPAEQAAAEEEEEEEQEEEEEEE